MPDEGEANQHTFKSKGLYTNLNEGSYVHLNEESVNVELDTSREGRAIANNNRSPRSDNKIETLEDIETAGQNGAFISKKSSPPMITP